MWVWIRDNLVKPPLLALDRLANQAVLDGRPGATISGHAGEAYQAGTKAVGYRWLRAILDWLEPGHCERAAAAERKK